MDLGPGLSDRTSLPSSLRCHSFRWFLDHVYPNSGFPDAEGDLYFGQVREAGSGLCLDALGTRGPAGMRQCHGLGGYQVGAQKVKKQF